jgi:hypothetical protein
VGKVIRSNKDNNLIIVTGIENGVLSFVEQDAGSEYNPAPKIDETAEVERVAVIEWKDFLQKTGYMN